MRSERLFTVSEVSEIVRRRLASDRKRTMDPDILSDVLASLLDRVAKLEELVEKK